MMPYRITDQAMSHVVGAQISRAMTGRFRRFTTGGGYVASTDWTAFPFDFLRPIRPSNDHTNGQYQIVQSRESAFRELTKEWHVERGASSSITEIAICPAYQRIIAMGEPAVLLILRQMESEGDEPDMWFWALRAITNVDPITDDIRGDVVAMADAWLDWGRRHYAW